MESLIFTPSAKKVLGPFQGDDLEFFMGHRKPMRWVDEVTEVDGLGGGLAKSYVGKNSLMLSEGKVFTSALIEVMGQSYGYIKAVEVLETEFYLSVAYLAAVDSFKAFESPNVQVGEALKTRVQQLHNLHPFYVISAEVYKDHHLLCRAKLKCYANYERRT